MKTLFAILALAAILPKAHGQESIHIEERDLSAFTAIHAVNEEARQFFQFSRLVSLEIRVDSPFNKTYIFRGRCSGFTTCYRQMIITEETQLMHEAQTNYNVQFVR